MEKSPRPASATKREEAEEDQFEYYRDSQRKVQELEMVVEALRQELETHKQQISKVAAEKLNSEIHLKEQFEKEQIIMKKLTEDHEQLKKDHEFM